MKRFAVIGIGPVGAILSAHLIKKGENPVLVDILKDRMLYIKKNGLSVKDPKEQIIGSFTVFPEKIAFSIKEIKEKIDVIFICVKTYALKNIISELKEVFSPPCSIISFQNGLDNEEFIAQSFGKENVLRVVVNYAGGMRSYNEVEITFFNKPNYIGVLSEKKIEFAKEVAGILTSAGLETKFSSKIKKYEWEKTILNAALSPLCAVTGLTMKEVMEKSFLKEIVENLLREGIKVAQKNGIKFQDNFLDFCISYLSKGGLHKPSMLIDIEKGSETEIDFINGKIAQYAEKFKISAPYNKMITSLVKALEMRGKK